MLFPPNLFAVAGVPLQIDVPVYDADNDNVNVTWDFGDGTSMPVTMSAQAGSFDPMVVVSQTHSWSPVVTPGTGDYDVYYTLSLTGDDGNGNVVVQTALVTVHVPFNEPPNIEIRVPTQTVDPSFDVTIVANATDSEGEALTWTFIFTDDDLDQDILTFVNYTPVAAPGELVWNNVTHVFGIAGNFTVTLFVSDALPGNQVFPHNKSVTSTVIRVENNRLPTVLAVINVDPQSPVISASQGFVQVNCSIGAFDLDGDVLQATWDFGDGSPSTTNMSEGGTGTYIFEQIWICTNTGSFNVSVTVTDGYPGHEVLVYLLVNVTSVNQPPSVVNYVFVYPNNLTFALANETQHFTWIFTDSENDPIEVIVDFGDNSTRVYLNLSEFIDNNVTLNLAHSYSKTGLYTVTVWYTDNKVGGGLNHTKSIESTVNVGVVEEIRQLHWDWWDYTGLSLFAMIPVLIASWMIIASRRRKKLEEKGMTLEEWELIKSLTESSSKR